MKPYKTIQVSGDTSLASLLDQARDLPLLLERNGERYRLERAENQDLLADSSPAKVRAALEATVGSWADVDAEALIAEIHRWRQEGTRPAER